MAWFEGVYAMVYWLRISWATWVAMRSTSETSRGVDASNLRCIRLFYKAFPNCDALRHELSWAHYPGEPYGPEMSEAEEGVETARLVPGEVCRRLTTPRNSVTDTSVHAAQKSAPWDACVSHRC